MLNIKIRLKAVVLTLSVFGSSSAFAADNYTYIGTLGDIMSSEVCDAGILSFVTDKPLKISVKGEYANQVEKNGLRGQYLYWLYENERSLFDRMAEQVRSPNFGHLIFAKTPEEAKTKMEQYGGFTTYNGCNGRLLVTPTEGFEFDDPHQKPWGGLGNEKNEFLKKYFKDHYLGKN